MERNKKSKSPAGRKPGKSGKSAPRPQNGEAPKFYSRPGQSKERPAPKRPAATPGSGPANSGQGPREERTANRGFTPGKPKAQHRKGQTAKVAEEIQARRKAAPPKPHSAKGNPRGNSGAKDAPRPMNYRQGFDILWRQLFSSPVHLDSALSKAPPSLKSSLAEISRLLLQRPRSLAHYLRFKMTEDEPWYLSQEQLAEWPTARAMGDRLFQAWKRDPYFNDGARAQEQDYPPHMIEEWKRDFGHKVTEELIVSLSEPAPLALRASRRQGRNEVLSALNDSREIPIRARASSLAPLGFYYDEYVAVMGHPLFEQGAYEIQDEGSQVMALFALWPKEMLPILRKVPGAAREWPRNKELPAPRSDLTVVDACAGAGGKTLAMADALGGKGQIYAYDVSAKKLEALRRRATRSNLFNIKAVAVTENEEDKTVSKFKNRADVLLIDAPCSGWGTLRRNPDVKWRQEFESLDRLEALQARLLDAYAPLVKKGGTLTYGVCTFRKKETTDQVAEFLKRHPDFESIGGGYLGPKPSDAFFLHAFRRKDK
jgi:16S rRNA C967 or C1407 C5-methylase (RsmB/RsmF family)